MGSLTSDMPTLRQVQMKDLPSDTFAMTSRGWLVWRDSMQPQTAPFQAITERGTSDTYTCDSDLMVTILPKGTKITITI